MDDYPPDFIDTIRAKAAMGWVDEHKALLQEIDNLTDMLKFILNHSVFIQQTNRMYVDMMIDKHILEWWQEHKDNK